MKPLSTVRSTRLLPRLGLLSSAAAFLLAACGAPKPPAPSPATPEPPAKPSVVVPAPKPPVVEVAPPPPPREITAARTVVAYRKEVARAVYAANRDTVHAGKLPPLLYAVLVVSVVVDSSGNVRDIKPVRVPSHASDNMAEVRQLLLRAALPVPKLLPNSVYKYGRFEFYETFLFTKAQTYQVLSLSEGQKGE